MRKVFILLGVMVFLGSAGLTSRAAEKNLPLLGPVKLNAHPSTLEGKTILLRWNGKMNGDKYLTRVGENLNQQAKRIKIIKLWELYSQTAAISQSAEASREMAEKIAGLKPDLVIAAQAD